MRFEDFAVGQTLAASLTITRADFDNYISFARTTNVLQENPQLAEKECIKGVMLPGRSIIVPAIDFEISRVRDKKLVVVSRKNLYRIKKSQEIQAGVEHPPSPLADHIESSHRRSHHWIFQ